MIKRAAILENGVIHVGRRHSQIIEAAIDEQELAKLMTGQKGFVTDTGEFVNRSEAAKIALECGQIFQPVKRLYSEDIL